MKPFQHSLRFGVLDEPSTQPVRQLQHDTKNCHPSVTDPKHLSRVTDHLSPFLLQSTEYTVQPKAESYDTAQELQGLMTPSTSGTSLKPDTRSVGPWVVSNRKVQKRYRERQKV